MKRHGTLSEAKGMANCFADPHCPWQRGHFENTNGLH